MTQSNENGNENQNYNPEFQAPSAPPSSESFEGSPTAQRRAALHVGILIEALRQAGYELDSPDYTLRQPDGPTA